MGEEYSISREDALRILTMGGAYRMMMENKIGSIEDGKLADLAVLSADPLTCPDDKLRDITAAMTMLGGEIVYKR
jgi:predicted amidohydrolase YtcJ